MRFKTRVEFLREFGPDWKLDISMGWNDLMDVLHGQSIPSHLVDEILWSNIVIVYINDRHFSIGKDMITDEPIGRITQRFLDLQNTEEFDIRWEVKS